MYSKVKDVYFDFDNRLTSLFAATSGAQWINVLTATWHYVRVRNAGFQLKTCNCHSNIQDFQTTQARKQTFMKSKEINEKIFFAMMEKPFTWFVWTVSGKPVYQALTRGFAGLIKGTFSWK